MKPETGAGWFPRISPVGLIACGNAEVFVGDGHADRWSSLGPGNTPYWLGPSLVLFNREKQSIIHQVINNLTQVIDSGGYNEVSASLTGAWCGKRSPGPVDHYIHGEKMSTSEGVGLVKLSPDARHSVFVDRPQENIKNLYVDNEGVLTGEVTDYAIGNTGVCWVVATGMYTRSVYGIRFSSPGVVEEWSILDWEAPQIVDTPEGPWVLSGTQTGFILRRAGDFDGFKGSGEFFYPHCLLLGSAFTLASSDNAGRLQLLSLPLAAPRVSLRPEPTPTPIPPVPPTPVPPVPPIPPQVTPLKLHPSVITVVRAFASMFPVPQGDGPDSVNEQCREWIFKLNQTLSARFPQGMPGVPNSEFGHKRADPGRPPSKETVALQQRDAEGEQVALHGWDMLKGVGTGKPVLQLDPEYKDLMYAESINGKSQIFIPVPAIDHLKLAESEHAPLPAESWWCSAFDLMCRFAEGDYTYFNQVILPSGLVPRIILASVYRTPRTPWEGVKQLRLTLATLKAHNRKGVFSLLVDTAKHNLSEDDALAVVRACVEEFLLVPEAVEAIELGNENSHSVEMPYMTNGDFIARAKALIPHRFAFSPGAGHGGEGFLLGGSFVSHHSDRSLSPEENGALMGEGQVTFKVRIHDSEPFGITEANRVAGRQRTADAFYAVRLVRAARANKLPGSCLHTDSGITCQMADHGPVHQEAFRLFTKEIGLTPIPVPPIEVPVTPEQIAQVFAGAFFERIGVLLKLDPKTSVADRRPAIHAWIAKEVVFLNQAYKDVFGRPVDLEGAGSRILLALEGKSHAEIKAILVADKNNGAS